MALTQLVTEVEKRFLSHRNVLGFKKCEFASLPFCDGVVSF